MGNGAVCVELVARPAAYNLRGRFMARLSSIAVKGKLDTSFLNGVVGVNWSTIDGCVLFRRFTGRSYAAMNNVSFKEEATECSTASERVA